MAQIGINTEEEWEQIKERFNFLKERGGLVRAHLKIIINLIIIILKKLADTAAKTDLILFIIF